MTEEAARKFIGPSGLHSRWKEQRRKLPPPPRAAETTVGADVSCTLSSCHSGTLKLYDVLGRRNVYMTQDEREGKICNNGRVPVPRSDAHTTSLWPNFSDQVAPNRLSSDEGGKFYSVRFSFLPEYNCGIYVGMLYPTFFKA